MKYQPMSRAKKRADPTHDEFLLEHSPFYRLAQVEGIYQQRMQQSLKAVGTDLPRWRVLMILHEKSPSTVSEIADRAVMKLSTMTRVAQRLATDGLVTLAQNADDARRTDVHITAAGEVAVENIRAAASRIYRQATSDFTDAEVATLNTLLARLSAALR